MVIGGGIAGMYTALRYIERGVLVTLVEKNYQLGGNIKTIQIGETLLEAGPSRFNKNHRLLLQLLQRYGLHIYEHKSGREFRPILDCKRQVIIDPTPEWIQKVLSYSKKVNSSLLKNITFNQLCEMVLGFKTAKQLIESFGYNAEFLTLNAYSAVQIFKEDFMNKYPYYSCVEGLSELVKRMEKELIEKQVTVLKNTEVHKINFKKEHYSIHLTNGNTYEADHIIFALPKSALMSMDFFNDYAKSLFNTVVSVSLHRIYAKFVKSWFKGIVKFTTDLQLRQFIPIDEEKGIAMVSYSDLFDADYWKTFADQGSEILERQLDKQLKELFPRINLPKMEWVTSYYWKEGVHTWIPNIDPEQIREKLNEIYPNIAIVGESYSLRQGWIEGALETVESVIKQFENKTGGATMKMYTSKELKDLIKKEPSRIWVLLKLPMDSKTRIIDVTEWSQIHPGGAEPYIRNMYKDITKEFLTINHHYEDISQKNIKQHVLDMVHKYTIGYKSD